MTRQNILDDHELHDNSFQSSTSETSIVEHLSENVHLNGDKTNCCCESQIKDLKSMINAQTVKLDAMHDILKTLVSNYNELLSRKSIKMDANFKLPNLPLNFIDDVQKFDKCLYDQTFMDQIVSISF